MINYEIEWRKQSRSLQGSEYTLEGDALGCVGQDGRLLKVLDLSMDHDYRCEYQ
jgi:hypothetical protein